MTSISATAGLSEKSAPIGFAALVGILCAAIVVLFFLSIAAGPVSIGYPQILASLTGEDGSLTAIIIEQIRLPRAILAIAVGAACHAAIAVIREAGDGEIRAHTACFIKKVGIYDRPVWLAASDLCNR